MTHTCKDCDQPADPDMTMDFTDVEPGAYLYWCTDCGLKAHAMSEALMKALNERGPEFRAEFERALEEAEQEEAVEKAGGLQ